MDTLKQCMCDINFIPLNAMFPLQNLFQNHIPFPPPPSVRINRDTKELILIELNLIIVPEENSLGR